MTTFVKLSICQFHCFPSSLKEVKIVVDDNASLKSHAQFKLHVQVIKVVRESTYSLPHSFLNYASHKILFSFLRDTVLPEVQAHHLEVPVY